MAAWITMPARLPHYKIGTPTWCLSRQMQLSGKNTWSLAAFVPFSVWGGEGDQVGEVRRGEAKSDLARDPKSASKVAFQRSHPDQLSPVRRRNLYLAVLPSRRVCQSASLPASAYCYVLSQP